MEFQKPYSGIGHITQKFGEKITNPGGHTGIDYALCSGTPVQASETGDVALADYSTTPYGNYVLLNHREGFQTLYAHLSGIIVSTGDPVLQNQMIGYSGNSGNSTGPHLHFEMRCENKPIDPQPYLDRTHGIGQPATSDGNGKKSGMAQWQVLCDVLNVRSGPGIHFPVCDQLMRGTTLAEEERSESCWIQISSGHWAAMKYDNEIFMRPFDEDPAKDA